jgi:hypothetical protein
MNNHFGFSFTPEHICYAYFIPGDNKPVLDRLGKISYTVPYGENDFYSGANKAHISDILKDVIGLADNQSSCCSISVESNLGILKRILLPANLDDAGKKEQIHWDLSESLTLPLTEYSYFRSPVSYTFKNFNEELVIAIPKRVIRFFRDLANGLAVELTNISMNQLAAELLVQNALNDKLAKFVILQKITGKRVESTFLWHGSYYASHYDMLDSSSEINLYIELLKEKIGYIENLFKQYGETDAAVEQTFLYGDELPDDTIKKIQKNMSVPVDRLNAIQNLALSQNIQKSLPSDPELSSYVECIGITLDV